MRFRFARVRRWNAVTATALVLLIIFNVAQCVSLVKRAPKGTDFTVFYDTGKLLDNGASAEIYLGKDETTEWLRTIPPFGQAIIYPFEHGSVQAAALGWGVFNLLLLAATAWALREFAARLDGKSRLFGALWPASVLLLLAMAPASIQVGQFSVLFVACWVFSLGLLATRFRALAGAPLAIPIAIKIYPALLLLVPILARRPRFLASTLVFSALCCALPFAIYGARTPALNRSFWRNAIASSKGRVAEAQRASSPGNQGLDSVALRYLTSGQPIQKRYPQLPHLALLIGAVMNAINAARAFIVLVSLIVGWRFWRRGKRAPLWGQALLLALICAALYAILPGAKTRYAIYAFPAFWPLLCCAFAARKLNKTRAFWAWSAFAVACLMLLAFTPSPLRLWGWGWFGALALWIANCVLLWRWSGDTNWLRLASKSRHNLAP